MDTKGVDAGSEKTEASLRRMAQKVNDIGATAKAALNKGSTYNVTAQVNRRTLFDLVLEEGKVRRTVTGRNPFETV